MAGLEGPRTGHEAGRSLRGNVVPVGDGVVLRLLLTALLAEVASQRMGREAGVRNGGMMHGGPGTRKGRVRVGARGREVGTSNRCEMIGGCDAGRADRPTLYTEAGVRSQCMMAGVRTGGTQPDVPNRGPKRVGAARRGKLE